MCLPAFTKLFTFIVLYSIQITATPTSQQYADLKRADNNTSPGIGIELECRSLVFTSNNNKTRTASDDDISNIKGKTGKTLDNSGATISPTKEWILTADHTHSGNDTRISKLTGEFMVDGLSVKLGSGRVGPIAKEILGFMVGGHLSCVSYQYY